MPREKLAIGWFTFTCSEDSTILFIELLNQNYFRWKELVEFRHCKPLKSMNVDGPFDVAFIEGAISTEREEDELRRIRGVSTKLVAVGSCACTGMPAGQRNAFNSEAMGCIRPFLEKHRLREKVVPVKSIVKVDESLPGCPMVPSQFVALLERYIAEHKGD